MVNSSQLLFCDELTGSFSDICDKLTSDVKDTCRLSIKSAIEQNAANFTIPYDKQPPTWKLIRA